MKYIKLFEAYSGLSRLKEKSMYKQSKKLPKCGYYIVDDTNESDALQIALLNLDYESIQDEENYFPGVVPLLHRDEGFLNYDPGEDYTHVIVWNNRAEQFEVTIHPRDGEFNPYKSEVFRGYNDDYVEIKFEDYFAFKAKYKGHGIGKHYGI